MNSESTVYHKRRHAARTTDEYLFHQLVPYLGNKRRLLHGNAAHLELARSHGHV
jgi:adenine-specific DNA-methyltransferase